VLAVGDAEFQSKCLGKMKQVSQTEGRTILFVSHNLTAVKNLCTSALYLQNGQLAYSGDTEKVINYYLRTGSNRTMSKYWDGELKAPGNEFVKFKSVVVNAPDDKITVTTPFDIEIEFLNLAVEDELNISLHFYTISGELLFNSISEILILRKGLCKGVCKVPGNLLNDGIYYISIMLVKNSSVILYNLEEAVSIEVNDERPFSKWHHKWEGYVRPILDFPLVSI
jgi:lipopolysaccharide transport system ATP-binding protein